MANSLKTRWTYFSVYLIFISISLLIIGLFDKSEIHLFSNNLHHPIGDYIFKYLTDVGDGITLAVIVVVLFFFSKRSAVQLMITGVISGVIAQLLKKVVFGPTPRPSKFFNDLEIPLYYVDGVDLHSAFSFPSGHATTIFALTTTLLLINQTRKYDLLLILTAIFVGYSRIYLSQHFLIDVVAGSAIGVSIAIAVFYMIRNKNGSVPTRYDFPLINLNTK